MGEHREHPAVRVVRLREALPALRERHVISKQIRTPAGMRIRVLAPSAPVADAVPVAPDLEDAYLAVVHTPAAGAEVRR